MKTEDIYASIAKDVEKIFVTSNFELDRLLSRGKSKKAFGLMKDELAVKIMAKLVALRPKTYSC